MSYVQRNEAGEVIGQFANCQPGFAEEWLAEDCPELSYVAPAQLEATEREWRGQELARLGWLRDRHRDQLEINHPSTLSGEQYIELLTYIQALRDWPQSSPFPDLALRPQAPDFVNEFRGEL